MENKIRQTRNINNLRNEIKNNQSINIIQDYNENHSSEKYPNIKPKGNYLQNEIEKKENQLSNSQPYCNNDFINNNDDTFKREYSNQNLNSDLYYQSNQNFNPEYNADEVNHFQENSNMQNSFYNNDFNQSLNYKSNNNSYIKGERKKNHSSSMLENFSNLNIGYIPNELSRSPAMRKSIDRSKILRRDYGCYEKLRKSSIYDSIDNDNNQFEKYENESTKDEFVFNNYPKLNSSNYVSSERYLKNQSLNYSQNKSLYINGSVSQNRNYKRNNRSPIRKELIFNDKNYERRSQISSYNENASRRYNNSTAFSMINNNLSLDNKIDYYENLSIDNLKNLSMFSVKSDQNKIKSQNLATFLYDLVIVDSLSESNKESLSLRTDISVKDLFLMFDISNRNSISLVDFQDTLKKLDIYVPLPELKLTFKRFDSDMDGRLE